MQRIKNINDLTRWFLELKPLNIFLLSLLGFTFSIWMFSIIYQLDKKVYMHSNKLKLYLLSISAIYLITFQLYVVLTFTHFQSFIPFNFLAILCGFTLMIYTAKSYVNFENKKGYPTHGVFEVFWMLGFYLICVWSLQRNLNKYIND